MKRRMSIFPFYVCVTGINQLCKVVRVWNDREDNTHTHTEKREEKKKKKKNPPPGISKQLIRNDTLSIHVYKSWVVKRKKRMGGGSQEDIIEGGGAHRRVNQRRVFQTIKS